MTNQSAHFDLIARLSGNFLTCHLPDNWADMDADDLRQFMEDHAWEPFEYWDTDDVFQLIEALAYDVQKIIDNGGKS